jgi:hypothetical protein
MEKEFIPYEQALALKELGFDEKCLAFKDFDYSLEIGDITKNSSWSSEIISIPLYQQAFRWFREKYKLHIFITPFDFDKIIHYQFGVLNFHIDRNHLTYEEAELECLKKLIEIVKSK